MISFRFRKEVPSIVMVSGTWYLNTFLETGMFYKTISHANKMVKSTHGKKNRPRFLGCVLEFNSGSSNISRMLLVIIFLLLPVLRMLGLSTY